MFMQFKKFLFLFLLSPVLVGCQKLDFSNIDFTQFYSIEAEVVGNYDYSNKTFSLALNKEVYIKNKTIYNYKTFEPVNKLYVGDYLTFYYDSESTLNLKYILLNPAEVSQPFHISEYRSFLSNTYVRVAINSDNTFFDLYSMANKLDVNIVYRYQADKNNGLIYSFYVVEE
jgi:hypothetical protein